MKRIFGIFDKVSGVYGQPMFCPNPQVMVRSLGDELARDRESVMAKHPKDFCLHDLGGFDEETGSFECNLTPKLVVELEFIVVAGPVVEPPVVVPPGGHDHQVGMP